jgi:hypothetical protein
MEPLDFDEFVDVLRQRIGAYEVLHDDDPTIPSFKDLMSDYADVTPEVWYWHAFEELEAQGHLSANVSFKANGGDANALLSADGRLYLRRRSAE